MKTTIALLLSLLCSLHWVSGQNQSQSRPVTLPETFTYLDKIFADDTTRYGFMTLHEYYLPLHYQTTLGKYIGSNWGLTRKSRLKNWFVSIGVENPDDMSAIILRSYHRHLNHQQIDLEEQVRQLENAVGSLASRSATMHSIYDFREAPPQAALLKNFPVGDTLMVYTAAENNTALRAFGVVRAHKGEALLFEITYIEQQPNAKPTRQVGDMVEGYPSECFQLPPPGWKWEE